MTSRGSITTKGDFRRLLAEGRRARRDAISVHVASHPQAGQRTRLGLAVRVWPLGAVARNRVRRRLREAFWACAPGFGYDVVIRATQSTLSQDFQVLTGNMARALRAAGVQEASQQ